MSEPEALALDEQPKERALPPPKAAKAAVRSDWNREQPPVV